MEDNRKKALALLKNIIVAGNVNNDKADKALNSFIKKYNIVYISFCKNKRYKWCYIIYNNGKHSMEITDISILNDTLKFKKLNDTVTMNTTVIDDVIL